MIPTRSGGVRNAGSRAASPPEKPGCGAASPARRGGTALFLTDQRGWPPRGPRSYRWLKLALVTVAFVSQFIWIPLVVYLSLAFMGWCARPVQRGWAGIVQVATWAATAWVVAFFILLAERIR